MTWTWKMEYVCLRCCKPFDGPLPHWQVLLLCDGCADAMLHYVVTARNHITGRPNLRLTRHRIVAVRRMYHRPEYPPGTMPDLCESATP